MFSLWKAWVYREEDVRQEQVLDLGTVIAEHLANDLAEPTLVDAADLRLEENLRALDSLHGQLNGVPEGVQPVNALIRPLYRDVVFRKIEDFKASKE